MQVLLRFFTASRRQCPAKCFRRRNQGISRERKTNTLFPSVRDRSIIQYPFGTIAAFPVKLLYAVSKSLYRASMLYRKTAVLKYLPIPARKHSGRCRIDRLINSAPSSDEEATAALASNIGAHPVPSVCSASGVIPAFVSLSQHAQNSSMLLERNQCRLC